MSEPTYTGFVLDKASDTWGCTPAEAMDMIVKMWAAQNQPFIMDMGANQYMFRQKRDGPKPRNPGARDRHTDYHDDKNNPGRRSDD